MRGQKGEYRDKLKKNYQDQCLKICGSVFVFKLLDSFEVIGGPESASEEPNCSSESLGSLEAIGESDSPLILSLRKRRLLDRILVLSISLRSRLFLDRTLVFSPREFCLWPRFPTLNRTISEAPCQPLSYFRKRFRRQISTTSIRLKPIQTSVYQLKHSRYI